MSQTPLTCKEILSMLRLYCGTALELQPHKIAEYLIVVIARQIYEIDEEITFEIAEAITDVYSTYGALCNAYEKCKDVHEATLLIYRTVNHPDRLANIDDYDEDLQELFKFLHKLESHDEESKKEAKRTKEAKMKRISIKVYQTMYSTE